MCRTGRTVGWQEGTLTLRVPNWGLKEHHGNNKKRSEGDKVVCLGRMHVRSICVLSTVVAVPIFNRFTYSTYRVQNTAIHYTIVAGRC